MVKQELQIASSTIIASDASEKAMAAIKVTCNQSSLNHVEHSHACGIKIMVKPFSDEESEASSAWRELKCLHELYVNRGMEFFGQSIVHMTDNKAVAFST